MAQVRTVDIGDESTVEDVFCPSSGALGDDGVGSAEEADDMTCAICLDRTPLVEIALVKGCEHQYCVNCILQWSLLKEWCPQCKKPFDYLLTHKQLDGTVTDFLSEESVVLLKRARWFDEYMRTSEKGKATMALLSSGSGSSARVAAAAAAAAAAAGDNDFAESRDWADFYEDYVDAELEEDEEIESYYFSSAAGRARVVLGNRRWGEGGYMRAGRMYARPVVHTARTPNAAGGKATAAKTCTSSSCKKAASSGAASSGGAGASSSSGGSGSSSCTAAAASSGGASSSRGRSAGPAGRQTASSSVAPWLVEEDEDDEDDFTIYDDDSYSRGNSNSRGRNSEGSSSRSRPRSMIKPVRQVPKGAAVSPAVASAAMPVVDTPLGRSPGSSGFHVGSWGAAGKSPNSCGGMWAAAAALSPPGTAGSSAQAAAANAPGSGRRARRNARRAAMDGQELD